MPRFQNISAATAPFPLLGRRYAFTVHANFGGGSVSLQTLAADDTTWLNAITLTADGMAVQGLPDGQYRVNCVTATGVYAALAPASRAI